jgi:hypothetical protein
MRTMSLGFRVLIALVWLVPWGTARGQEAIEKEIRLQPRAGPPPLIGTRLMTPLPERVPGNAALTLLRMSHERTNWINLALPKLTWEFVARDYNDPELLAFPYDAFAEEIILAGNMNHADWGYPLNSPRPYEILMPDAQMMRHFLGAGMTVWIKQQIAKGDLDAAMRGIRAQLNCARHISSTPIVVSHMIGSVVANQAVDNLELLSQHPENTENYYWACSVLPRSLADVSAAAEWDGYASSQMLPSLSDPWPAVGSEQWQTVAREFVESMEQYIVPPGDTPYSVDEVESISGKLDEIASRYLAAELSWTQGELKQASREERIMRWLLMQRRWFDLQAERMAAMTPVEALAIHGEMQATSDSIMQQSGLRHNPFFWASSAILGSHRFQRRVRFMQAIEAIRDHVATHEGAFPENLEQLRWSAPTDPLTESPFVYEKSDGGAWLSYPGLPGDAAPRKYRLVVAER